MKLKEYVNYIDFGAKGDGISDDFAPICAAHDYANEKGLPVVIDDGRTYLIRNTCIDGEVRSAIIKTDVLWGSAKIIIDDTQLDYFDVRGASKKPIFKIASDYDTVEITDSKTLSDIGALG